jgi:uncharacterized membrane protein
MTMTTYDEPDPSHHPAAAAPGLTTARLEAFSDGVFAVAATLLVVELHVPDVGSGLGPALLAQWPSYVTYATSFGTIGIIWVNHHALFAHVHQVDRPLLFYNLLLLMTVSVIPFPTALLGRYVTAGDDAHLASAVYGGVMLVMSLAFQLLWAHVTRDTRLIGPHLDPRQARQQSILFGAGHVAYLAGMGLSYVSSQLALLLYALIAIFYVFPWLPPIRTDR